MLVTLTNLRLSWLAAHLLPLLTDATIKGSCILLVLTVIMAIFRRMSAATRYCLWFFGAMSLLLLPILQAGVPAWHVLPRWPARADVHPIDINQTPWLIDLPSDSTDDAAGSHPVSVVNARSVAAHSHATAPRFQPRRTASPAEWLVAVWLAGMGICIAWLLLASLSLHRLRLRCTEMRDTVWLDLLERLRRETGFKRSVVLLTSRSRMMPMTWGIWRTCVLLPDDSMHWPAQQRRTVLLHELSHAIRFDCLTQLLANLASATQWYNPLVWLARHRLQVERERACDDRVVGGGVKASTYAEQLLQIAFATPLLTRNTAALAMAGRRSLQPRLRAILDQSRNRQAVTPIAAIVTFCLIVAVSLPLACAKDGEVPVAVSHPSEATQPATTQATTVPISLTGAAELYNRAAAAIKVTSPINSDVVFPGGGYFPYSSTWTEMARTSFIQNATTRRLAHEARLIRNADWPPAPIEQIQPNGQPGRKYLDSVLHPARIVAYVLVDAAYYQHFQGDDAGAAETIKDLLWMATLMRQQSPPHYILRCSIADGCDLLACSRMMVIAAWANYSNDPADTRALQYSVAQDIIRQLLDQKDPDTQVREISQADPDGAKSLKSIRWSVSLAFNERCFVAISLACHLYRFDHQQWPQSLEQLVPAYLPSAPIDAFGDGKQPLGYVVIKDGLYPPDWNEPKDKAYHGLDRPLVYSRCRSERYGLAYPAEVPIYDFDGGADSSNRVHRHGGQFRDIAGWIPDIYPPDGPTTRPVP